jgi:oligopeptide transport system substrate-binding protein
VPPALDRLIVDLLGKAPDDRPGSAEVVLETLRSPSLWKPDALGGEVPILEAIQRGRMVARETELGQVRALWAGAQSAGSQLLLVRGEAGIGKTRLVRELVTLARVSKGVVLQAWNDDRPAQPFAAFRQILRRLLDERSDVIGACPEPVVADLLALLPELQVRHPNIEPRPSLDSAADQHHLFESVAVCLTLVSQAAPILLVIEDAQWADSGTLLLLRYLVQQTRTRPVLYVLTYRTAGAVEARELEAALAAFRREALGTTLTLERLGASGTLAMLQALLGESVPNELVEGIQQATEGNPLYIEEVCKGLVESGRLVRRDGDWRLVDRRAVPVPASLRVAVEERLRRLPAETQQALEAAAVWGPVFQPTRIAGLIGIDQGAACDALAAAEQAEIIRPLPDGAEPRSAFAHALIAAAVVEGLAPQRRRALHAGVAAALEAQHPDDHEALAFHFREAGDRDKAVEHLMRAGDRAKALHACREAIESYQAAIDLQAQAGDRRAQACTLLRLGLACSTDFQFDAARSAYERAFDLWEAALESEPPESAPELPVTLRYGVCEPVSLDPGRAGDDLTAFVIGQLMEGLVELDEAWGIVPSLASRWTVSSDGCSYTFHLRPGWRWSDGRALTAHDFEYAWKRNLALAAESPAALLLYVLRGAQAYAEGNGPAEAVGVQALDDRTLEARLDRPAGYFPQLLTHPVTFPLPRWVVEGDRQPWTAPGTIVCNGAWLLEAWERGKRMAFTRNPRYRGLSRGNAARIEAPVVEDHQALLPAFEAGDLDGISLLRTRPMQVAGLRARYRRQLTMTPYLSTFYLSFNCGCPPFDNLAARQAFVQAIDRVGLLARVDMRQPPPGGFLPPGMPGHNPALGPAFDPDRARQRMIEAGYPEGGVFPEVEIVYTAGPGEDPVTTHLIRGWWEVLGVKVTPVGLPWDEFLRRRDSDPPALSVSGWSADYPDPDNLLRVLFHSREGLNAIRWRNADFDSLSEQAAVATDRKVRLDLYARADRLLVEEQAAVAPLWYRESCQLLQPYVSVPRVPACMLKLKDVIVEEKANR